MPPAFDPEDRRRSWLEFFLDFHANSDPESVHPRARGHYASSSAGSLVGAYLVGLEDEVRPMVEKLTTWMERQPEPDRRLFADDVARNFSWLFALYQWRQALGLCKWLGRGDSAETEFARAVEAEWQVWDQITPKAATAARSHLRRFLGEYLATALAGNVPALGLKLYDASGVKRASGRDGPARGFGEWACRHLAAGGARDAAFTARGEKMLTKTLLFQLTSHDVGIEQALWLKAIYFDSGLVQTPEQAIVKAYDSMPGVPRPNFIPV
jgi:hypothetical protein